MKGHGGRAEPGLDSVLSAEDLHLQLLDSASQQSRPGQPATPDQILPFLNATSLHSSAAARCWASDSRELSAFPQLLSPQQPWQHPGTSSTAAGKAEEPAHPRERLCASTACPRKRLLAEINSSQHLSKAAGGTKHATAGLRAQQHAASEKAQGGTLQAACRIEEEAQASGLDAAQTDASAEDDARVHRCDSYASALAPLMRAHVRSKPPPPAEVTDDSEALSNSSSDKALQLSLAELRSLFGVPLTEAAARLGVQRQDLVRSCRRHNLEGWPRLCISVTEAARSDNGSTPASAPSDADASELAAFVPFGPGAHRAAPAASQAHSVHTRSSSRAGGNRARAARASEQYRAAPQQEEASGRDPARSEREDWFRQLLWLQGLTRDGRAVKQSPSEAAGLLGQAVAREQAAHRLLATAICPKVPGIKLDRPGMWAPRILQARAQVEEATSAPAPMQRRPAEPAAAGSAAAVGSAAAAQQRSAGPLDMAAEKGEAPASTARALGPALGQARPRSSGEPQTEDLRAPERAVEPSRQQQAARAQESQDYSHTQTDSAGLGQPPGSPAAGEEPAANSRQPPAPPGSAQPAPEALQNQQKVRAQPAASAPLEGGPAHGGMRKKRLCASHQAREALSAPHILSAPAPCWGEVSSQATQQAKPAACSAAAAAMPAHHISSGGRDHHRRQDQGDGAAHNRFVSTDAHTAEQGPAGTSAALAGSVATRPGLPVALASSCTASKAQITRQSRQGLHLFSSNGMPPMAAQALPRVQPVTVMIPCMPEQPPAAEQAAQPAGHGRGPKPPKKRGRSAGAGRATRAKALDPGQPAGCPEGRRPLKKSRKALEAEEALLSLGILRQVDALSGEVPGRPGERCDASAPHRDNGPLGSDQAAIQAPGEQPSTAKGPPLPQISTSRHRGAKLGHCKLPRPESAVQTGRLDMEMECAETLSEDLPGSNQTLNHFLNLSPPPALPGTIFGGSICNSLLGSPLPRMDTPDDHHMFYGEGFNDLSLGAFSDIADSNFDFGCFNN